jgi:hypothetical protein
MMRIIMIVIPGLTRDPWLAWRERMDGPRLKAGVTE